jgi:hypothetical protein
MADDKMRNDDLQKNVGGQGNKEGGQQTPGRNPQDDQSTGQRPGSGNEPKRGGGGDDEQTSRHGDEGGQRR